MPIISPLPYILVNGTVADATQVDADFNEIVNDVNANAAANGANNDITSLTALTTPLSVAQGGTGGANGAAGGYRNIARRNGGLEIWQRGAGGAASIAQAASLTGYMADGWYLVTGANQASVVSQQAGIANGSQWSAKVLRNSGQTGTGAMTFGFPLDTDELYPMLGQFMRLSLTLKAGANWSPASGNITIALNVGTGTPVKFSAGYTGATVAATLTQAITTSAVRYQVNSSAVIPTTTRQAEITLTWTPVGTAGVDDSFSVDDVQVEIVPASAGYVASNFERLIFEEQLLLCQRHYQKSFIYSVAPAQNVGINNGESQFLSGVVAGSSTIIGIRFSLPTRVTPSVTTYNPQAANAQIRNATLGTDCGSTSASSATTNFVPISGVVPGSTIAANIMAVGFTVDAGI